jgi:ABC-type transporter Mla subunit MlaD
LKIVRDSLKTLDDNLGVLDSKATLAIDSAAAAYAKATTLETKYTLLAGKVDELSDALADSCAALRQNAQDLYEQAVADAKSYTDDLVLPLYESVVSLQTAIAEYNTRITNNENNIAKLQEQVDALQEQVDGFEDRIATLEGEVAKLKNDLSKLITGIIIQGTEDPIFGYAALPFGIQTNILAGYYGDALTAGLKFPTTKTGAYVDASQAFTAAEQQVAGFSGNDEADADTIYAGILYVTINPTNIDFSGQTLKLETSAGKSSPILLKGLKKSTTELSFGITKAERSNGFYEAEAYILPEDASQAAPNFDLASVKSVASQLLNEHTFSLSNAVSAVYNNVSNICPRYGAYVEWENSDGEPVAVYSNYAIADIAIKPLSYGFLAGKTFDFGYSIPTIDPNLISDAVKNLTEDFNIEFDFGNIDLGLSDIKFDFSAFDNLNLSLNIEWSDITIDAKLGDIWVPYNYNLPSYKTEYTLDTAWIHTSETDSTAIISLTSLNLVQGADSLVKDSIKINLDTKLSTVFTGIQNTINTSMQGVINQISAFSSQLDGFTESLQSVFEQLDGFTSTITGMQDNINDMFTTISGNLSDQIDDMIGTLTDKISGMFTGYINTANSYITKINSVIDRVTSVISEPNSKLQPVLLFTQNTGTSAIVSASQAVPTIFQITGSGVQGTTVIATSYTGELLAPAFKKYIAVVDVINGSKSAQGGDADCLAAAKLANNAQANFATVLDGGQRAAVFTTDAKYAGYTYEIAYAALDYSGKMVTRRFFVKVIK